MNRPDIQEALDHLRARRTTYALPRAYYNGNHRLLFASDRFHRTFGGMFRAFADNFCAPVVDTLRDRLRIETFTAETTTPAVNTARALWRDSRMPAQATQIHEHALVEGDAYLIVWRGQPGTPPTLIAQHPGQCAVIYDDETPWRVKAAIKVWKHGKRARITYYTADKIERFVSTNDTDEFPETVEKFTPVTDEPVVPNPYGVVPVFHFPNGMMIGGVGRSELQDAIPINDAVNKLVADMLVASEFVAWPQRWATGIAEEIDPVTGKPVAPFQGGVERLFTSENPDARFGQLEPAAFDGPIRLVELMVSHLAGVTGTPHHAFLANGSADWPSGEALKTAEARLVARAVNRHDVWGPVWEDAMRLAVRIAGADGAEELAVEWRSPESRSEKADLEAAVLREQIGFSRHQNLVELGYSTEEADRIVADRENDDQAAVNAQRARFDAGLQA